MSLRMATFKGQIKYIKDSTVEKGLMGYVVHSFS